MVQTLNISLWVQEAESTQGMQRGRDASSSRRHDQSLSSPPSHPLSVPASQPRWSQVSPKHPRSLCHPQDLPRSREVMGSRESRSHWRHIPCEAGDRSRHNVRPHGVPSGCTPQLLWLTIAAGVPSGCTPQPPWLTTAAAAGLTVFQFGLLSLPL